MWVKVLEFESCSQKKKKILTQATFSATDLNAWWWREACGWKGLDVDEKKLCDINPIKWWIKAYSFGSSKFNEGKEMSFNFSTEEISHLERFSSG